jgi:hypothetical protein
MVRFGVGNRVRLLILVLFAQVCATSYAQAATVSVYQTYDQWRQAVQAKPDLTLSGPTDMLGGVNDGTVRQGVSFPSGIATVDVSRGQADSPDDIQFRSIQAPVISGDGSSFSVLSSQNVLSLRLSNFTIANAAPGDFLIAPQGYRFEFQEPNFGFGLNFSGAGSTNFGGTTGSFLNVLGLETNLTRHGFGLAGFGFFGVVSEAPISNFEIFFQSPGSLARLSVNDFSLAIGPTPAVVPLPSSVFSLLLCVLCLCGLSIMKRRHLMDAL